MQNLLAHFDPSELIDFMNFIGLSIHKLQEDMLDVLDQLIGPLSTHINGILSQPVTGTDDQVVQVDTKRAYLALLISVISSKLHTIFISDSTCSGHGITICVLTLCATGNKGQLESLLESMLRLAEDPSDPSSEKAAFSFLGRCVSVWAEAPKTPGAQQVLPGFERFAYERMVPTAFAVLSLPQFNIKDGQIVVVRSCAMSTTVMLIAAAGPTRDRELPSNCVEDSWPRGLRFLRQQLPPVPELAPAHRLGVRDEDAGPGREGLPKILHGLRACLSRRLMRCSPHPPSRPRSYTFRRH